MLRKMLVAFSVMLLALTAGQAQAVMIIMEENFNQNDCSGFFGTGFDSCQVVGNVVLSPVIAKFGAGEDLGKNEFNSLYPSIDGSEWTFTPDPLSGTSGTWTYTPGPGDPGIKYWAAKAGNDFKLFWAVENSALEIGGACEGHNGTDGSLDKACLDEALVQTSGTWSTPDGKALSHLTFYDTGGTPVPEPGTLLLFGSALSGLWFFRRRFVA